MLSTDVTECLEDGIGLQDLLLYPRVDVAGDRTQVLQDELGGLGLAGPALARYHAGLVALGVLQGLVRRLRQGEHMRLQGAHFLLVVSIHVLLRKDVPFLKRVPAVNEVPLLFSASTS